MNGYMYVLPHISPEPVLRPAPLRPRSKVFRTLLIVYAGLSSWLVKLIPLFLAGFMMSWDSAEHQSLGMISWALGLMTYICLAPVMSVVALVFLLLSFRAGPDKARRRLKHMFFLLVPFAPAILIEGAVRFFPSVL